MEIRTASHVTWPKITANLPPIFLLVFDIKNYVFSPKYTEITWYTYNLISHHLLSRSISDKGFIVILCLEVEFPSGWCTPPSSPQEKERVLTDQNQKYRRVKVTGLRSRIYTHLKSHLIHFQRMFGKTAVWEFEKIPRKTTLVVFFLSI